MTVPSPAEPEQRASKTDTSEQILRRIAAITTLPPYDAAISYRELVRLEAQFIRERLTDAVARRKYEQYLSTYFRPAPRREFTDHNWAQKLVPTIELLRAPSTRTVLDAAGGNGFEAVLFALHGKRVHANDCAAERFVIAKLRCDFYRELIGSAFDLTVTVGNVLDPPPALERYDMVFVQEAISHIHPADEFLALTNERYLNSGGHLVVCDSNVWNPVTRTRILRHFWATKRTIRPYLVETTDPRTGQKFLMAEEQLFNPVKMEKLMRAAGFAVDRVVMTGFVLPAMMRALGRRGACVADRLLGTLPGVRLIGGFYTAVGRKN